MSIITRKVEIYINAPVKEEKEEYKKILFALLRLIHRFSNMCVSHLYFADNIAQFRYFAESKIASIREDNTKLFEYLSDHKKTDNGLLEQSYSSLTWDLSKTLKPEERKNTTKILSDTGNRIYKTYTTGKMQAERFKVINGEVSVKNYKENVPIPISKQNFKLKGDGGNYIFDFYHIPFRTKCGKDFSGNRVIINRVIDGSYELSDSSIQYNKRKNKWFLLLTVKIPTEKYDPVKGKVASVELGIDIPLILKIGKNEYKIGDKDEFLHRRLQIQAARQRLQRELQYNVSGGRGRRAKLEAIDRYHLKEKQYVQQKMHVYSKKLVNICRKNRVETINLSNFEEVKDIIKKDPDHFLLRNWSYYGLTEKIKYKSSLINISVTTG